jgi:hypothetical protein
MYSDSVKNNNTDVSESKFKNIARFAFIQCLEKVGKLEFLPECTQVTLPNLVTL